MKSTCLSCGKDVFDIDVRCSHCGAALSSSGAHRMLGSMVLGQYEIVDVLGQGGMSVVFKGRHKLTEQEVALKILPPELAAHSQVKSRFLDEAKALAALDHANIVHLYNFGQENGCFVLAMQYVQGRTWERMILESKRLDWVTSARICVDVLRALEYAHGRGVVHRDMKPSNVLVRSHDNSATVMDFGIAKMTTSTRLTATGQTMGTVRYMSPEQVRGQEVDLRTDIYSLGATFYESLTGETPFDGSTHFEIMTKHLNEPPKRPSAIGIDLPLAVEDALMRSLAKRAEDRFGAARELRRVLEQALRDADLGLIETQRLERPSGERASASGPIAGAALPVGDGTTFTPVLRPSGAGAAVAPDVTGTAPIPTTPRPSQRALRHATANDLADELEPGESVPRGPAPAAAPRRRRRLVPVLALAVALGAGGVAGALVMARGGRGYQPTIRIEGATLTQGERFGALLVETDGGVSPAQVEAIYRRELAALRLFVTQQKPALSIPDPVTEIAAMPLSAMCLKSNWLIDPPKSCGSAPSVTLFGPQQQHRMFVVSDPARLDEAIRRGIAQAACELETGDLATPEGQKRNQEVCGLTDRFLESR